MILSLVQVPNNLGELPINPDRLLADLKQLAEFGAVGRGVNRTALSPADMQARSWLVSRMQEAGLSAYIDGVGNLVGRTPHKRRIVIGSHTDTVPNGGWLDGAMGVICGLEVARAFMEAGGTGSVGLEVVSFSDEEGTYFSLLGSRSYCGDLDFVEALKATNEAGTTVAEALRDAGLNKMPQARLDAAAHLAYLEPHIEQGPILEAEGTAIGIVSAIVGVRRWRISYVGQADHAGTTPMRLRRDAGAALCEFAVKIADVCRREGSENTVWNGGNIRLTPGAHSVVNSRGEYLFSIRDENAEVLARIGNCLGALLAEVSGKFHVEVDAEEILSMAPAAMDAGLVMALSVAAEARGLSTRKMPSGALHDAMVLSRHVPSGMLFIPSIGGRSHDVVEDSAPGDIINAANVIADTVAYIARSAQKE